MESRVDPVGLAPGPAAARRILGNPALGPYLEELARTAETARGRPIPSLPFSAYRKFDETGDRRGFESLYFQRRRDLVALALSAWLRRGAEDIKALEDELWAICDEYSWALPAHLGGTSLDPEAIASQTETLDLFSCETAFAFAEILSLLGDSLTPIVARRAAREVERRVLGPFLERRESWPWEIMRNNWCAVCAGSVGSAALYLVDDRIRLDAILARLLPTLDRFLESFPGDGTCLEGLGYWTYGVGFFVSFADILRRFSGIDLLAGDKFHEIAAFQSKAYLTPSIALGFADGSSDERFRIGLAAFLARRFPDAAPPSPRLAAGFGHDAYGRWCLSFRDLLWSADYGPAEVVAPALSWLPEAQWLICPAASGGSLGFAAKGGHNDEPHNHNDSGSFQLALGGAQLFAELGAGEYTKEYFGAGRYSIFCTSSLGHSLPIVAGGGQEAGAERRARSVDFRVEGGRAILSMDIAAAYDCPSLIGLERSFDFDGSGLLILRDEFKLRQAGIELVERFVTGLPASQLRIEAGMAILEAEGGRLSLAPSLPGIVPRVVLCEHRAYDGGRVEVACLDFDLPRDRASLSVSFEFRLIS